MKLIMDLLMSIGLLFGLLLTGAHHQHQPPLTTTTTTTTTVVAAPVVVLPPPPQRVVLFGDSLTQLAAPYLRDFAPAVKMTFYGGTTIVTWAQGIQEADADVLILALGSNDAQDQGVGPWEEILASLPADLCVVWPQTAVVASRPEIGAFDDQVVTLMQARPHSRIIRWDQTVAAHPEWIGDDGVHYVHDGQVAYAHMLADAALGC